MSSDDRPIPAHPIQVKTDDAVIGLPTEFSFGSDRYVHESRLQEVEAFNEGLAYELGVECDRAKQLRAALDWALNYVGGVPAGDMGEFRDAMKLAGWAEPEIKAAMVAEFGCDESEL